MENQYKIKGSPAQGLFGATLAFFVGLAAVALFGPTAKGLAKSLNLDAISLGFLIGIPSLTGALMRIPFGAWVEETGGKLPNLILLGTALVGMKQVEHVRDNLTVARHAPLHPDQFTKLFT